MNAASCPATLELNCGPVSAVDLALFAAAAGDHNPLHLDADVASQAGFDRPVVHGMLTMAYAGRLFTRHFGPRALLALSTRFVGVAKRGERITLSAQLGEHDAQSAHYTVRACTDAGVEIVTGSATVRLGSP